MRRLRSSSKARLFLQPLEHRITPSFGEFLDPNPAPGNQFGATVVALSTGNVVVTSPFDDFGGTDAGAVYLFNGKTGALISTLRGSTAGDRIGSGSTTTVTALTNGNYVVSSRFWDNGALADAGAATWGDGKTGVTGVVSAANSFVGGTTADFVSTSGVTPLTNGNYVVRSAGWHNGTQFGAGAATWGNGVTGSAGVVNATNSLVGSKSLDGVSQYGVIALTNGNYVVCSPSCVIEGVVASGAVTWGNGMGGTVGVVSSANSLFGSTTLDNVGSDNVTALPNGNYVVVSPFWDSGAVENAGAVTWGNGATGTAGAVTAANSLIGGVLDDRVGTEGLSILPNGNYIVRSASWHIGVGVPVGAVTWGNGTGGTVGLVSATNSLVGSKFGDQVGSNNGGVIILTNGNYVVSSPFWDNGALSDVGAVTWCNGVSGTVGTIGVANSLVGGTANDKVGLFTNSGNTTPGVVALTNGNYVVRSELWNNGAGAITWGNGASGTTGTVSVANSMVGGSNHRIGFNGVTALANGNYAVASSLWRNGSKINAGAVTWGSGTGVTAGVVSAANSLVGGTAGDVVGDRGVIALTNGNYVVPSRLWTNGSQDYVGAVTWGNGNSGTVGLVSTANSLVGSKFADQVGSGVVTALANGNYVVSSPNWINGAAANAGAVTWGNGATGTVGVVSASNSLVGVTGNDSIGSGGVTALANGNYVVNSPLWDNGAVVNSGAATFGKGGGGTVGVITTGNSAIGAVANAGLQSAIADNVSGTFLSRFLTDAGGRVRVGSQGNGFAPSVTGFVVNGGADQRSRLTTIVVNFSSAVDAATLTNLGAITLTRTSGPAVGTVVQTGATGANGRIVVSPASGNVTSVTLQFDNANAADTTVGVDFGSLTDGRWQLAIPSASFTSTLNDPELVRLYGDANGDGFTDNLDLIAFRAANGSNSSSPNWNAAFDSNGDGFIDNADFLAFRQRLGLTP